MDARLTVADYLMGRDAIYPEECTPEIRANAEKTVESANALIARLEADGIVFHENPRTKSLISSGWRPPQINGQTKNAAPMSKHMTGQAIDLYDPEGEIDDYLMANEDVLIGLSLFMEHPSATKGWAHVQTVAPRSGKRCFYP